MTEKPRIRVAAWSSADSFQNFQARIGLGTQNLQSGATYGFNPVTRNRQLLEWMYGGSWIVGKAVDAVAEDMTRAGVEIKSPGASPDDIERLQTALNDLAVWQGINETVKWSRLYGGAIGVLLIDGQKLNTPLRIRTVGKDQFRGIAVLDRWMVNPSLTDLVTQYGPELGQPVFYDVVADGGPLPRGRIHHSRVIRLDGIPQPYWRKMAENGWGLSVVEPLYDRLVAFDSTTNGAAQLVHKAHLRTLKVKSLREIISMGGKAFEGLAKQVENIRLFQTNEGLTLVDDTDTFETHAYSFTGLDDLMLQFSQQLSGALDIPLVRLMGQSPAGLNATGESDIRNYYDGIKARQEARLRRPMNRLLRVLHQSELGRPVDEGFNFAFVPLWQLSETEKAQIAAQTTTAVTGAYDSGVIDRATALKELRQSADVTGVYSNIEDEDIKEAEEEPPPSLGEMGLDPDAEDVEEGDGGASAVGGDEPPKARAKDAAASFALHGLPIVIESPKGSMRTGKGWQCAMAADYGYIGGTWSAEGRDEEMDCFIGPAIGSDRVFVIDQVDPDTGRFDEHKCMLGYASAADAIRDYVASYSDRGLKRIAEVTEMAMRDFKAWLADGRLDRPVATRDAGNWNEEDHPRRKDGKFGRGAGDPAKSKASGQAKGGEPESGAEKGFGTRHLEKGDVIGFRAKGEELTGKVVRLEEQAAIVRSGSKSYRVPWGAITSGAQGKGGAAPGASERGDHFIAPEKFSAADFARQHDDASVTPEAILSHFPPDTGAKIEAAQKRLASIEQTVSTFKKGGEYDPARKALHRQIIIEGVTKKVLNEETGELEEKHFPGILSPERVKAATPKDGQAPTFTILGGRGGSGKSWFKGQVYDEDSAIVLDSDHIKSLLPEYEGWNAAQVHEESSEIFDRITEMAKTLGLNIVHDATMKSPDKAVKLVNDFKGDGYRVEAHYMHLPRQEAAKRAVSRFLDKPKRLVPPAVVLSNTRNEESFDAIRGLTDAWSFRDNNVPKGEPPRLISEGKKGG